MNDFDKNSQAANEMLQTLLDMLREATIIVDPAFFYQLIELFASL